MPTALRLVHNASKRPVNLADGINPEVLVPSAPSHLCAEAKKEWKRISIELESLGLISNLDRAALALYCQAWGHMVMLEKSLGGAIAVRVERGEDPAGAFRFTTDKGYQQQTVTVQMLNTLRGQVATYLKAFGLDPSSRSRVTASSNQGVLPGMDAGPGAGWGQFKR